MPRPSRPPLFSPLVDKDGRITPIWQAHQNNVFNQTGGTNTPNWGILPPSVGATIVGTGTDWELGYSLGVITVPISVGNGGTGNTLTAGTQGQLLQSDVSGNATWTGATYPITPGTAGQVLSSDGTNIVFTTTSGAIVPGPSGTVARSTGAAYVASSLVWTDVATPVGTFLRSDGTGYVGSSVTIPNSLSQGDILYSSASNTLTALAKNASATRYLSNTGTSNNPAWAQIDLTVGVSGLLPLANGGTNASLTASNGGIIYSTASALATLGGTATAGKVLQSGSSSAPTWSTPTYPSASGSAGQHIKSDGTNNVYSTLVWPDTAPSTGKILVGDGSNYVASTPTFPNASATSGKLIQSDGTNWLASSSTWPTTGTLGDLPYASASNTFISLAGNITTTKKYLIQTGNGAASAAPIWGTISSSDVSGAALTTSNDTNITLTTTGAPTTSLLTAAGITAGWTGQLGLTRGGTAASLVASNGGIIYSNASSLAVLAGTATAGQILQSGASTTPAWSTPTYPSASGTSGKHIKSDGTNNVYSTLVWPDSAAGAGKILIGDGTNYVASTPTYPNTSGTSGKHIKSDGTNNVYSTLVWPDSAPAAGKILIGDGTNFITSTPTYPNTSATSGKHLKSDGTNFVATTTTFPDSGTTGKLIIGNGTNYVESTPTYPNTAPAAGKILVGDGTNVVLSTPTYPNASATSGKLIQSDGTNFGSSSSVWPTTTTQGDILYASAANTVSSLAKNTTATRYLANTGTTNNPAWDQVNVANGVTGILPVANGGIGVSSSPKANVAMGAGNQTLTNATITKILWDTTILDTGSYFDIVTNHRYTPLVAGNYLVLFNCVWSSSTAASIMQAGIYKNASAITVIRDEIKSNLGYFTQSVFSIINMNGSTDYIETYCYQNTGVSQLIVGAGFTSLMILFLP